LPRCAVELIWPTQQYPQFPTCLPCLAIDLTISLVCLLLVSIYRYKYIYMGYLEPSYYNFPKLEKRHYYSRILKFAIAILDFPQICHEIRIKTTRTQLQAYTKTYITLYLGPPLNDMWVPLVSIFLLLSSSTNELPYISPAGSRGGRRRPPPARAAPLATVGRR
jgi:hypothetical protein